MASKKIAQVFSVLSKKYDQKIESKKEGRTFMKKILESEERLFEELISKGKYSLTLDLGIGTGRATKIFKKIHPETKVIGVDISYGMLKAAEKINQERICADIYRMPIKSNSVDLAYSLATFTYIKDLGNAMKEAYRVLKPKGQLLWLYLDSKHEDTKKYQKWDSLPTFVFEDNVVKAISKEGGFRRISKCQKNCVVAYTMQK